MPNLEWDVGQRIVAPAGTLLLNQPDPLTGYIYRVRDSGYQIVPSLRVTADNISQMDGSVLHTRYLTGLVATMTVTYHVTDSGTDVDPVQIHPACGNDLRLMHEHLTLILNDLRRLDPDPLAVQRYFWQPTGYGDERMLVDIQIQAWPQPSYENDGGEASVTFSIETPFPYAIDSTEIRTDIGSSSSDTITNAGTANQWPVVQVFGPTPYFELRNYNDVDDAGDPKVVTYDSALPGAVAIGGGDYAEIDFFRGTIFLNGSTSDLIAGLDPSATDFWTLQANTANLIGILGASARVLSNNAWA